MMSLKLGTVLVTEGKRSSLISQGIAKATGSWATHVVLRGFGRQAIEATTPRVRAFSLDERIATLRAEDRAIVVLDIPEMSLATRFRIVEHAHRSIGKFYDLGQIALFTQTGRFWSDGPGTMVCSRLITDAYHRGGDLDLFPDDQLAQDPFRARLNNLRDGYATPADLLRSALQVVDFLPSSRCTSVADQLPSPT